MKGAIVAGRVVSLRVQNVRVAERLLSMAGIPLAALLNAAFDQPKELPFWKPQVPNSKPSPAGRPTLVALRSRPISGEAALSLSERLREPQTNSLNPTPFAD